jgi:glutamine synthetase
MSANKILDLIREYNVENIMLRFTDLMGTWRSISYSKDYIVHNINILDKGVSFKDHNLASFNSIADSVLVKPDLSAEPYLDPFTAQSTLVLWSEVVNDHGEYIDPRSVAKRAINYLSKSNTAVKNAQFGCVLEFFIFDDVRHGVQENESFYKVNFEAGLYNSSSEYDAGNFGYRGDYLSASANTAPIDSLADIRAEIVAVMNKVGIQTGVHYSGEVPGLSHIEILATDLIKAGDWLQQAKHIVRNVVYSYGKTATFMPRPISSYIGSAGMPLNIKLVGDKENILTDNINSTIVKQAISGIIHNLATLSLLLNPTTNSYARLATMSNMPMVASEDDNTGAISTSANGELVCIFPDHMTCPYYAYAAVLMAIIDGLKHRYDVIEHIQDTLLLHCLPSSLAAALLSIANHEHRFLYAENVFDEDCIEAYVNKKLAEHVRLSTLPHPIEFAMYYSA